MSRTTLVLVFVLIIGPLGALIPAASGQVFPDITVECGDNVEIDVSPGSSRTAMTSCELENNSMWIEEVSVDIDSEDLDTAGPESVTIGAGETLTISIVMSAAQDLEAGDYLVNVSAEVTSAGGVPVPGLASDTDEIGVTIAEFTSCDHTVGQGGGTLEAGQIISFSISISCDSNTDSTTKYSARLVDKSGSSAWPSGFDDQSPQCDVLIPDGGTSANCQFQILTPSNLDSTWEGCVVVLENGASVPKSCPSSNVIDVKIEPKSIGIGTIDLTGNDSVFGEYSDEAPIIIGGVAVVLVLAIIGIAMTRRRRRLLDD
ncbi:MAG: choice-of-anchor T family protein [Candidatus Thalassarchaeum sp.]